jgi:hypothetical protein
MESNAQHHMYGCGQERALNVLRLSGPTTWREPFPRLMVSKFLATWHIPDLDLPRATVRGCGHDHFDPWSGPCRMISRSPPAERAHVWAREIGIALPLPNKPGDFTRKSAPWMRSERRHRLTMARVRRGDCPIISLLSYLSMDKLRTIIVAVSIVLLLILIVISSAWATARFIGVRWPLGFEL